MEQSDRVETQRSTKAILDVVTITGWQHPWRVFRLDLDRRELDAIARCKALTQVVYALHIVDFIGPTEAAGLCDLIELDTEAGMADLHAGFTEMAVVEHGDGQVGGLLQRDRGQGAKAHQQFTI